VSYAHPNEAKIDYGEITVIVLVKNNESCGFLEQSFWFSLHSPVFFYEKHGENQKFLLS